MAYPYPSHSHSHWYYPLSSGWTTHSLPKPPSHPPSATLHPNKPAQYTNPPTPDESASLHRRISSSPTFHKVARTKTMTPRPLLPSLHPPLHQTPSNTRIIIILDRTRIPPPQHLFLRPALFSPLVDPLDEVDCAPDFEFDCFGGFGICGCSGEWTLLGSLVGMGVAVE
jgi:hypothetical protein